MKRFFYSLDDWLSMLSISSIVAVTIAAVFMRYVLHNPLQWVEEVLISLFIWAIMLGAVSAMKSRSHVSIDFFVNMMPLKARRLSSIVNDLISIVVLFSFGVLGLQLALGAKEKITSLLGIKYMYLDIAVPIGCFWMCIYLIYFVIQGIRNFNKPEEEGES